MLSELPSLRREMRAGFKRLEQAIARTGTSPEIFVDLDVTSPLRLASDIAGVVELLSNSTVTG